MHVNILGLTSNGIFKTQPSDHEQININKADLKANFYFYPHFFPEADFNFYL